MKNLRIEFKWAMIFTFLSVIWMYMEKNMGWFDNAIFNHQFYTELIIIPLLYVIVLVFGLREKKKNYYSNKITWEQALVSGGVIAVIVCVFSPLLQYYFSTYISPHYFENATEVMFENSRVTRESAQDVYNLKASMIDAILFNLAMGIVSAAIIGIFIKTPKKEMED